MTDLSHEQPSSYDEWLHYVDLELISACGMTHLDFNLTLWRGWYDDGMIPRDAASICMEDARNQHEPYPCLGYETQEVL